MAYLNTWYWRLCESFIYAVPASPVRVRDPAKPMQVLCVGMPRTGTESLQTALLTLGYDHTYHGWDIIYEEPNYAPEWCRLARRKWFSPADSPEKKLTRDDFDAILGHSTAVTDAAGSVFAAELIEAYPDAKVVLNTRGDLDKWLASMDETVVEISRSWTFWVCSWFGRDLFWAWNAYERYLWPLVFRSPDGTLETAVMGNGKWVSREHANMVRGLVPKERLLEWQVEDGWEPLCEFLGKDVPDEPFPHANNQASYKVKEEQLTKKWVTAAFTNLGLSIGVLGLTGYLAYSRVARR